MSIRINLVLSKLKIERVAQWNFCTKFSKRSAAIYSACTRQRCFPVEKVRLITSLVENEEG
jgi:hypothetical protein